MSESKDTPLPHKPTPEQVAVAMQWADPTMSRRKKIVTTPRPAVSLAHKEYLSKKRKQHALDRKQAEAIRSLGIHHAPLDLPSLHRAVHGGKRVPWLTTGYDWLDKPHRVANDATDEIRALRTYILTTLNPAKGRK